MAKAFRPISLSNYFIKGLERLVVWRMDICLESKPIHPKQHGFTKGKSTESALSALINRIEQLLFNKKHGLGVFLDISAAFDSIDIEHIRNTLLEHGGEDDFVMWYFNYLKERHLLMQLHGEELNVCANTGFPQGGLHQQNFG